MAEQSEQSEPAKHVEEENAQHTDAHTQVEEPDVKPEFRPLEDDDDNLFADKASDHERLDGEEGEEMLGYEEEFEPESATDEIIVDDVLDVIDDDDMEIEAAKAKPPPRVRERSFNAPHTDSSDFLLDPDLEEAKEEETISEEGTPPALDRIPYFTRFMEAMAEYGAVKRLNNFMHKKMVDYFRKRKMDHVLVEVDHPEEALVKYSKKLDAFSTLKAADETQRAEITGELTALREIKDRQCKEAHDSFRLMLEREAEIGTGLISAKTGKEIPDKMIEKLINNQKSKAKELQQLRLMHIKIRNAVTEKNTAIRSLDNIGDNYTLIEFEQLKIENQGHIDKIEERDDELSRLRKKCQAAIQCLAHVREKCSASEQNIRVMRETLIQKETEKTEAREEMNRLKQERDHFRLETQRLKEENGLLTKDKLLIDMENAMIRIDELQSVNQQKREGLITDKERLNHLKKHYDRELRRRALLNERMKHNALYRRGRRARRGQSMYQGDRASIIRPRLSRHFHL